MIHVKSKCESCQNSDSCEILNPYKCQNFSYSINSNFLSSVTLELENVEETYIQCLAN